MRLTFLSNYLNHHQLPMSNEFYKLLKDDFKFVAIEKVPEDKISLGYNSEFNVKYLVDGSNRETVLSILENTDVLIAGSCPYEYMRVFIDNKKPLFLYTERIFKTGTWHKYSPIARYNMYNLFEKVYNDNMYLLCSSAYTASDYNDFNLFKDHCLKWGYFPESSKHSLDYLLSSKKYNSIVWVGRLIDWKHPEQAIELARYLKSKRYDFSLSIIGEGPLKDKMQSLIDKYKLNGHVSLKGSMHFTKVREAMEQSEIFIFTSDFNEGWGAVLNEAMSSACGCVSSYKSGATPFLLDNDNGLVFDSTQKDLNDKVERYIKDKKLLMHHSMNAFSTINTTWNYKVAVNNFINFVEGLLNKKATLIKEGPVSVAPIITNSSAKSFISE